MSLSHSPSVVTNGLVFAYDQNNVRSYKGPPVQNLARNISMANYAATGITATPSTQVEQIPGVGLVTTYRSTIQNNYTAFTPNSADCCPALHNWGNFAVTPSTLYTYLILYKCDSEYTNSNYMYRYEYASNGGAYVTEGGVHNTTNRVNLGGGWYYAWGTFTTQSTTNWLGTCASFYYRYSNVADRLTVAKVAIIAGNYSGLHPKYWPNQESTRTNTQTIFDLTNNNTITATSLTYANSGTFSFNGSTNYVSTAQPSIGLTPNNWTISGFIRPTSATESFFLTPQSAGIDHFLRYDGANNRLGVQVTQSADVNNRAYYTALNSVPLNTWTHFSVSINNLTIKTYLNSIESLNQTESIPIANWDGEWIIGQRGNSTFWYTGQISMLQVYNRELSAAEVRQNFQALRGRYGL